MSVISPIKYGDNEQIRLSGIRSSREMILKDIIRDSTMSCVGSEKHN